MVQRLILVSLIALAGGLVGAAPASAAFGFLSQFGSAGAGAGQLFEPDGLTTDAAGNVYVADSKNHRIQKFDAAGNFIMTWGYGVLDGSSAPQVCTAGCQQGVPGSADGQFQTLLDVAVDGSGNVYAVEGNSANRVQRFDSGGSFVTKWGGTGSADGQFMSSSSIAAHAGSIYVTDPGNKRVQKFDTGGNYVAQWGTEGFGPGQFIGLWGIATDSAGNVYTVEGTGGNHRVQKFDSVGNPLLQFDARPPGATSDSLKGIDVDAAGFIYVTDALPTGGRQPSLYRFSSAGTLTDTLSCTTVLHGVAAHPSGNVYVSTFGSVLVFGEGGSPCGAAVSPVGFSGQESVTINDGAQFTNDPVVTLSIVPAANASDVRLSNDGGFLAATTVPVAPDGRYVWRLDSSGSERLPKIVYVRFSNSVSSSSQTFTDDIILDQTDPVVQSASLVGGDGGSSAVAAARRRKFKLRLRARDSLSGVHKVQVTRKKKRPGKLRKFRKRLTVKAARAPRYVRVRDKAGNFSKWRRIKRPQT